MKNNFLCLILVVCLMISITACQSANDDYYYDEDEELDEIIDDWEDEEEEDEEYDDSIPWNEAGEHIGEYATISGLVVGTNYASGSDGQPTFLNIGEEYPSQNRVTVIIWGDNRSAFSEAPEDMYYLQDIKVSGYIDIYNGIVQIEAYSEDDIEIIK